MDNLLEFLEKIPTQVWEGVYDIKIIEQITDLDIKREKMRLELKLQEEENKRKNSLMKFIIWMSSGVVVSIMILMFLQAFGKTNLDKKTLLILATGPPAAVVGYVGSLVRHYWPSRTQANAEPNETDPAEGTG